MDEYSNRRRVDICACCGGAVWQNRYWYKENCYCSFLCKINAEQKGVEEMENMEQRMERKLRRKEVFRLVEGHLRHYRMHKRLLMQYRLLGEEGAESVGEPQTPELADLPARMEGLAWHVAAVEDTLPLLDEEDLQFLELRYFQLEPMPVWQITEQMYISRSELYRRRERLVRMFARRFGYEI
ncbi:MAG: hypothetical protein IJO80_03990 [Firmicutes bacterium]|nr:hypothetical protein [Bacillota bacterium]